MKPSSPVEDRLAARMASLDALFDPASVALIGASDDPSRIGGRPLRYLKRGGYAGAVYPVNPNRDRVQGLKAYPDVSSIPFPVDVALIALPANQVVDAVQACARRSVKAAIIFSAGFTEAGAEGAAHQQTIAAIARESGMRVLGPNCALVGQDDVYDALLRQYGVHRADSIAQLVDIASACARGVLPADRSIGILTLSGGLGVQAADAAERNGLDVRPLSAEGQAKIKSLISFAGTANPIDVTAQATNEATLTGRCIEVAQSEGGYQSLVCLLSTIPAAAKFGDPILQSLIELRARYPDRLIVLAFASPLEVVRRFEDAGFPVFEDQDDAIDTIAALAGFAENFRTPGEDVQPAWPAQQAALRLPANLDEHAAKAVLADAGIPVLVEHLVQDGPAGGRAAAEIGGPVVLKIVSPDIAHKTEIGAVVLATLARALSRLSHFAAAHRDSVAEIDINPFLVLPQGQGSFALDALIVPHSNPQETSA